MKKICAFFLCLVLVCSFAIPQGLVLAADGAQEGTERAKSVITDIEVPNLLDSKIEDTVYGEVYQRTPRIQVVVAEGTDLTQIEPVITHTGTDYTPKGTQDFTYPVKYTVDDTTSYVVRIKTTDSFTDADFIIPILQVSVSMPKCELGEPAGEGDPSVAEDAPYTLKSWAFEKTDSQRWEVGDTPRMEIELEAKEDYAFQDFQKEQITLSEGSVKGEPVISSDKKTISFTVEYPKFGGKTVTVVETEHGTIQPLENSYTEDQMVGLVVTPEEGYRLKTDSLYYLLEGSDRKYYITGVGFEMPNKSVTVYGEFEPVPDDAFSVTVADGIEHGFVAVDKTFAAVGEQVVVTAIPDDGYRLSGNMTYNGIEIQNDTFNMIEKDVEISASFEKIPSSYRLSLSIGSAGGVISGVEEGYYEAGEKLTFKAVPYSGYLFVRWEAEGGGEFSSSNYYETNFVMPANDTTVVAYFQKSSDDDGGSGGGGGGGGGGTPSVQYTYGVNAQEGGSITPSGSVKIIKGGSQTFTITPDEGYVVKDVLVNGVSVGAVTSYTLSNVLQNGNIIATFEKASGEIQPPDEEGFTDIEGHWAKDAIDTAVDRGLFSGVDEHTFAPDLPVTRGMFVTVLGRLEQADDSGTADFSDVPADSYYAPYIAWASENGVVNGIGDGLFAPENQITREQMAVIIYNYLAYAAPERLTPGEADFSDNESISDWALDAVGTMQQMGILSGRENGQFDPKGTATRGETAAIMVNIAELLQK